MKKVVFLLIAIGLLAMPFGNAKAESDPFLINSSLWHLDFPTGGTQSIALIINNVSGVDENITVSSWCDFYKYPDKSYSWIDPLWITRINPSVQTLKPGDSMVSNVEFTLPDNQPDAKWITWIKVSDGVILDKPVVVVLRKGAAIPVYDYSLSPGDYFINVTGYGASAILDEVTDNAPPLSIRNKSNTSGIFIAEAMDCPQQKDSPEGISIISGDTTIQHTTDEIGLHLTNLTADEVSKWLTLSASVDSPIEIQPRSYGRVTWSLVVPDTLANGDYLALVRVRPAIEQGEGVGITTNVATWFRFHVDRHHSGYSLWPIIGLIGGIGALVLGYLGFRLTRTIKRNRNGHRRYA